MCKISLLIERESAMGGGAGGRGSNKDVIHNILAVNWKVFNVTTYIQIIFTILSITRTYPSRPPNYPRVYSSSSHYINHMYIYEKYKPYRHDFKLFKYKRGKLASERARVCMSVNNWKLFNGTPRIFVIYMMFTRVCEWAHLFTAVIRGDFKSILNSIIYINKIKTPKKTRTLILY